LPKELPFLEEHSSMFLASQNTSPFPPHLLLTWLPHMLSYEYKSLLQKPFVELISKMPMMEVNKMSQQIKALTAKSNTLRWFLMELT